MERTNNIFVTLFDYNYLSRGLTLYESLIGRCKFFHLYIIAFDDKTYNFLFGLELGNTTVISLVDFEDDELLNVKGSRTKGEYCWTSTPKAIQYIFDNYKEEICTYIDADIYFYCDPSALINEMPDNKSVIITEHRYSDYCDMTETSGVYNVQFMTFRNDEASREVLSWWNAKCIEACCLDASRGLCGDQKYLDDWMDRFECVHVLRNLGGGIGPWNVDQYKFYKKNDNIFFMNDRSTQGKVYFYHFHSLSFFDKGVIKLCNGNYHINDTAIVYLYKKYLKHHQAVLNKYSLGEDSVFLQNFRDDIDFLRHDRNYYLLELFL